MMLTFLLGMAFVSDGEPRHPPQLDLAIAITMGIQNTNPSWNTNPDCIISIKPKEPTQSCRSKKNEQFLGVRNSV
jgi:hypothetical protein